MLFRRQKVKTIDSRLFKYWQALYLSWYSRRLYVDVAKRWKGLGLKYFVFFLMIASIPFAIKSVILVNHYIMHDLLQPMQAVPEFRVINGKVQFEQEMPFFVRNHEGNIVAIIDTTDKINKITKDYPDVLTLVNSSKIYFRYPKLPFLKNDRLNNKYYDQQEITEHDLSEVQNEVFEGKTWLKEANFIKIKNVLLVSVYPLVVFSLFGLFGIVVLSLSILGQVIAYAIFKHRLKFSQTCRLSMMASTIGIGLFLVVKAFGVSNFKFGLFCVVLVFIYFSYGVLAVKRDSKQLVHY